MKKFLLLALTLFLAAPFSYAQCNQGNQTTYGDESWIGYVYKCSTYYSYWTWNYEIDEYFYQYQGYVTEQGAFDRNVGSGNITGNTANLCANNSDYFAIKYKMKKYFPAGTYTFTMGGDDGYRLKINNEAGYSINQWNDQSFTTSTITRTFASNSIVTFDIEYYEKTGDSRVSFNYSCGTAPSAPNSLAASTTTLCAGSPTTLTANTSGATTGSQYQFGSGAVSDANVIATQTSNVLTVSPTVTTTYWVRRMGPAPCNVTTGTATRIVTVTAPATAPTSITGNTLLCPGDTTTLTANGGSGSVYEWGTGTVVGSNIISGQTGASITVSPTAQTSYWVRRKNTSPCSGNTAAATITVSINVPTGNPAVFGDNSWIVYGYNTGNMNIPVANYVGYYTQQTLGFDTQDTANNGWNSITSPSSSAGWVGCTVPNDNFTMVHKRKGFPCGKYQIFMDNWDDEVRVLINGTQSFYSNTWSGMNPTPTDIGTFTLDPNSTIEVITREVGGDARTKMRLVATTAVYNGTTWSTNPQGAAVVVNANLPLSYNLEVCSCTVNAGATLTIESEKTMVIQNELVVAATGAFIIENKGSLVQINDNAVNSGIITARKNTTPVTRYDFTYWSSPVAAEDWTLNNLSPSTLADKYYSFNPAGSGWAIHYGGNIGMETGKGYIVRAPQSYSTTAPAVFNTQFNGKPNNGEKTIQAIVGPTYKSNLIGNPYPSAISADKFYEANKNVIKGTFYFWTHNIAVSSIPDANGIYNYSPANYIALNATGATGSGDTTNCTTCGNTPSNKHDGNIASGQGFFVEAKTSGTLVFNNSMRVVDANSNSQFLRSADSEYATDSENNAQEPVEKHRLWLNITNAAGAYNETLLGYITGATNGMDDDYDGTTYASGTAIYSLLDNKNLVIQGRALPFNEADVIPLGFIAAAGEFSIGLESFDGLFEDQKVYLVDKLNSTIHNIKNERYTFTTAAGTFNSRFELRFVNESSLGIDTPQASENDIVVYKSGNQIAVKANNFIIDAVQVYDLTGKLIYVQKNINHNESITAGLNVGNQVVIVKVGLDNDQIISKKVIMN